MGGMPWEYYFTLPNLQEIIIQTSLGADSKCETFFHRRAREFQIREIVDDMREYAEANVHLIWKQMDFFFCLSIHPEIPESFRSELFQKMAAGISTKSFVSRRRRLYF